MKTTDGDHAANIETGVMTAIVLIAAAIAACLVLTGCAYKSVQIRVDVRDTEGAPGTPTVAIVGSPSVSAATDLRPDMAGASQAAASLLHGPAAIPAAPLQPVLDDTPVTPTEEPILP